jgi:hypothetical protein
MLFRKLSKSCSSRIMGQKHTCAGTKAFLIDKKQALFVNVGSFSCFCIQINVDPDSQHCWCR